MAKDRDIFDLFGDVFPQFTRMLSSVSEGFPPPTAPQPVGIEKAPGKVTLTIGTPGCRIEDIKVSLQDMVLTIKFPDTIRGGSATERRRLKVNRDVGVDNITARVKDGLLTVIIRQNETAPPSGVIPVLPG